jgi:hypothetical protein
VTPPSWLGVATGRLRPSRACWTWEREVAPITWAALAREAAGAHRHRD